MAAQDTIRKLREANVSKDAIIDALAGDFDKLHKSFSDYAEAVEEYVRKNDQYFPGRDAHDRQNKVDTSQPFGEGDPHVDQETGVVSIGVGSRGSDALIEAVRILDNAAVETRGLALRRPSLDDVFLALTGHAAEEDGQANGRRRGRRRAGGQRGGKDTAKAAS